MLIVCPLEKPIKRISQDSDLNYGIDLLMDDGAYDS